MVGAEVVGVMQPDADNRWVALPGIHLGGRNSGQGAGS